MIDIEHELSMILFGEIQKEMKASLVRAAKTGQSDMTPVTFESEEARQTFIANHEAMDADYRKWLKANPKEAEDLERFNAELAKELRGSLNG